MSQRSTVSVLALTVLAASVLALAVLIITQPRKRPQALTDPALLLPLPGINWVDDSSNATRCYILYDANEVERGLSCGPLRGMP